MQQRSRFMISAAVAAMWVGTVGPVAAQEREATAVGELVVTASPQGLEAVAESGVMGDKTVLDTPFSVTVIDAAEIEMRDPLNIGQLFVNDPSVFSFATTGTVNWWGTQIRGLGVRNHYVDGAPIDLYWGGDYPLEPIESVQALKGATGFMYGFGSPGGVIAYRTKRPTEMTAISTEAGWRGSSVWTAHVDAGGPVNESDKLGYRVNLAGATGQEYNEAITHRGLASTAVDYRFTDNLVWRTTATYEDNTLEREPFHIYWNLPTGSALPVVPEDWGNLHVDNSTYGYHLATAATSLEWRINDDWRVDLTQGYARKRHRSNKTFIYLDDTNGDYSGYLYQFSELDETHSTQALLQGRLDTGPVRNELVLGASNEVYNADFGAGYIFSNEFNGNIYQRQTYLAPAADDSIAGSPYKETQNSVFASDTLYFGDSWQAVVGLRYTNYDLEDFDGDPTVDSGYRTDAVTPTLALLYKPVEQATIYASYVESLEGGSVVSDPVYVNIGEVLDATVSTQIEAGVKYDGGRVSLTGAVFRIEQANLMDKIVNGDRFLTQDGVTRYDGVEAIADFKVTNDLTLGLGVVHLDATIQDADDPTLEGTAPGETAEWQVVGHGEYNVPAIPGLSLHGSVRYYGEAETFAPVVTIPGYTLASVGANYRTEVAGRGVVFTANINNLFDKKYWGLQNFGERRNASVSVTVDW